METGVVKWFNKLKGFGFIISDLDGVELFVHYSEIKDGARYEKNLEEGEKVSFNRKHGDRGPYASGVEKKR
jgi:CspA family cold shock protein